MKATAKKDLCPEILKGDVVEIVPEYTYKFGENVRIGEYFKPKPGEVIIKKTIMVGNREDSIIIKCKREDIEKKP